MSHEDWLPTLLAAVGEDDIVEKLKAGHTANGTDWKVHLDGYNFMPLFKGEVERGPREQIIYFGQGGELNAVRWKDWKVNFAGIQGNIATGVRQATNWPIIVNLKADPYEKMPFESEMYIRWYADNMWLFVPIQQKVKEFFSTLEGFPFQPGSSLSVSNVNYNTLRGAQALKRLGELETLMPPSRQ